LFDFVCWLELFFPLLTRRLQMLEDFENMAVSAPVPVFAAAAGGDDDDEDAADNNDDEDGDDDDDDDTDGVSKRRMIQE
jgi:hypothetical protein